jgi:hypothetical protein
MTEMLLPTSEITAPPTPSLEEQVRELARLRKEQDYRRSVMIDLQKRLEETPEYQVIIAYKPDVVSISEQVEEAETELRLAAVQSFLDTQDKRPHPALGIRVTKVVQVVDKNILADYCKEHLPQAYILDMKFVEKHAKAVADTAPLPGVEIVETPSATVASDLSSYLGETA